MSMGVTFLTPTSREFSPPSSFWHQTLTKPFLGGSVSIASNNPFDPPSIDINMLATDFDVFGFRESLKAAQRFLKAPAWNDYIIAPFAPAANVTTDDQIDEFLRENVIASGHASGTCSMSPKNSKNGVVDPDLRVKGLQNLRVVDASVIVR
jgi:choline dehydrogenase